MATYCSTGEKAYLTIVGDNSSPYIFDGPIDVTLTQDLEYKGSSYRISVYAELYSTNAQCQDEGPPAIGYSIVDVWSSTGFKLEAYRVAEGNCPELRLNLDLICTGDFLQFQPVGARRPSSLSKNQRAVIASAPGNKAKIIPTVTYTGSGNPSGGGGEWLLEVKKASLTVFSRKYATEPSYIVRCDDPCPEGQVWDELCQACVCENLPGLVAEARAINQWIREKL